MNLEDLEMILDDNPEDNTIFREPIEYSDEERIKILEKELDNVQWLDEHHESLPEYKKTFEDFNNDFDVLFGNVEKIKFDDFSKKYKEDIRKELISYLEEKGFVLWKYKQFTMDFIHHDRKIHIFIHDRNPVNVSYSGNNITDEMEGYHGLGFSFYPHKDNKDIIIEIFKKIDQEFRYFEEPNNKKFHMVAQNRNGFHTKEVDFVCQEIDDYSLYYGKNFPHEKIKGFLEEENQNLLLLHGEPGTGKTNYIKNILIGCKQDVIYIPPNMLSIISSPDFITFMIENKDSILLIEDAEEVLSTNRNSATNNLLGMSDGFLKDALNLKIICTFNCPVADIDPALLRKGRLYFEYKFDKLSVKEAQKLSDEKELGLSIKEEMTLADIFNQENNKIDNNLEERKIGFGV